MSESKQDPKNRIPTFEDVKALISQEQAGFALVVLAVVVVLFSAVAESTVKILLEIGAALAFVVGLLLILFRERSNAQYHFRLLQQKDGENRSKIQLLDETIEQLRSELKVLHENSQKHIEEVENCERNNKDKETRIGELETSLSNKITEIQQKSSELQQLTEQIQILKEQVQPDKVAEQYSTKLLERIGNLYNPRYGRSAPITVVDVIEELYRKGDLQEEHFQDLLLKINTFSPTSDD